MEVETIYLAGGFFVLVLVGYDFFFTTLSGSGAGFLTRFFLLLAHRFQLGLSKRIGRRVFGLSGMLLNLTVLAAWILLVWLGLFLVFSYKPEAVVNSSGRAAGWVERLYFTGYILSTLGIGNFKPTTPFFEVLVSLLSFFGFIFFTTSMTYLISVSSAVMHKRSLALSIRNLGRNPEEVVKNLLEPDLSLSYQQISFLQQMIDRHNVNHQAYPVLHFYNNLKIESALSVNLAVLDEAVSILLFSKKKTLYKELQSLRSSLDHFLVHIKEKYSKLENEEAIPEINWRKLDLPEDILQQEDSTSDKLLERRKIVGGLLKNECFFWKNVYPEQVLLKKE